MMSLSTCPVALELNGTAVKQLVPHMCQDRRAAKSNGASAMSVQLGAMFKTKANVGLVAHTQCGALSSSRISHACDRPVSRWPGSWLVSQSTGVLFRNAEEVANYQFAKSVQKNMSSRGVAVFVCFQQNNQSPVHLKD